jgi:endonuclease YncB( thermonuclease family)
MSVAGVPWIHSIKTVSEFYDMLKPNSKNRIDCDPVGQRPDMEDLGKKQGIIDTMIRGYDFGEFKLRTLTKALQDAFGFKYRSIDGGHRKRAIRDFIDGKFKTHRDTVAVVNGEEIYVGNKTYSQLPEGVQDQFNSYRIRMTVYDESMTDGQAGETFRRTNISTDVNHQEMLNSHEDNLVAIWVREISRPIPGLNNRYHLLFEYTYPSPDDRQQRWYKDVSKRLRDDRSVSALLTFFKRLDKGENNLYAITDDELTRTWNEFGDPIGGMWYRQPTQAKKYKSLVEDALNFLYNYAVQKKNNSKYGLTGRDFALMYRFYVYMYITYGKTFRVKDFEKLQFSVRKAMDKFIGKDESKLRMEVCQEDSEKRPVCKCFEAYLTVHGDNRKSEQTVKWLLEEMGDLKNSGIVFLSKDRDFGAEMIEEKWRANDCKCEIDNEYLALNEAVGAHIEAWSEGGPTVMTNLMVVRKEHNDKMGAMNALDYKRIYWNNVNNVDLTPSEELYEL